jgi:hypothetical protein
MDLKCEFLDLNYIDGSCYTCLINEASITTPDVLITLPEIKGEHMNGKSNDDVRQVFFSDTKVEYLPRGLKQIFPALKRLVVKNCGLECIWNEDLEGLEDLQVLKLKGNNLRSLPPDLFLGMHKLQSISFESNKLIHFSSTILEPVENHLVYANFSDNINIDAIYYKNQQGSVPSIKELKRIIDDKCQRTDRLQSENFFNQFMMKAESIWHTGEFSDFTVTVGSTRKFKVHSFVLQTQRCSGCCRRSR